MRGARARAAAAVLAASAVSVALAVECWWRRRRRARPAARLEQSEGAGGSAAQDASLETEARLSELFGDVMQRSKGVCYIVSNKTNTAFSASNLAKYLRQKGLDPCSGTAQEDVVSNAELLVKLLERKGDTCRSLASTMRHSLAKQGISPTRLLDLFPAMKAAYVQQPLDYGRNSRYGDKWRISCYLVVMENWKPKIEAHAPMVECMGGIMQECVTAFEHWYCDLKQLVSAEASVMNAFVTRYKPVPEEDQLKKHIDGANVDGSVILALPTDEPCEGGKLHVWDGKPRQELSYAMEPGDLLFLDNAVWHQAKPITSGTRWALVLFLRLHAGPARTPLESPPPA